MLENFKFPSHKFNVDRIRSYIKVFINSIQFFNIYGPSQQT
jgi:hypothetical protein